MPESASTRALQAYLMVGLGLFMLCGVDVMIKDMSARYATGQILMMRFAFGLPVAFAVYWFSGHAPIRRENLPGHARRSLAVVVTAGLFFYALSLLPLAEAVALTFLSPLFVAMLAALLLKEHVSPRLWGALILGFGGVVVVASTSASLAYGGPKALLGLAAVLGSALAYALYLVQLRHQAQKEDAGVIILLQHVFPLLFALPFAFADFHWPTSARDVAVFALLGLTGALSQWLYTLGYARARASRLAIIEYTALLWSALFGYFLFGEWPGLFGWAGIALIVFACLWGGSKGATKEEPKLP